MKSLHMKPVCLVVTCGALKLVSVCSRRADSCDVVSMRGGGQFRSEQCVADL